MSSRFPMILVDNKYVPFLCRIILGGTFIYASIAKILYPAGFAEAVTNYQLAPLLFSNLIALTLPWVELIAGLLLLNGLRTQNSNLIIFLLICVFTVGIVFALIKGLDINCGCFSEEGRRVGFLTMLEEIILLLMSITVFLFDKGFFSLDNFIKRAYPAKVKHAA